MLYDQFVNGIANGSNPITKEDQAELDKAYKILGDVYNWTKSVSFFQMSSQKCSDMIIIAGKNKKMYYYFVFQSLYPQKQGLLL